MSSVIPQPVMDNTGSSTLPLELFKSLVEQAATAISVTDLNAKILYCNQTFCCLTGYSRQQILGNNQNLLASKNTPHSRYEELWRQLKLQRPWSGILINQRADGSQYLARVTVSPVLDAEGKTTHYIGMQQDITSHYELEQKLKNQKKRVEAVLNHAPIAIALLNSEGKVLLDNLAYKTMRYDFCGAEPAEYLLESYKSGKPALVSAQVRGITRWYELQLTPVVEGDESVESFFNQKFKPMQLLFIRDRTDQQQRQEKERIEQLKLRIAEEQLLEGIVETIAAACLQFQQPLNLLRAASQLDPKMQDSDIIQDVLSTGQMAIAALQECEYNQGAERLERLDVESLLRETLLLVRDELKAAAINVELDFGDDLRPIQGQEVRLQSLFKLLLDRAINAICDDSETARIRITAYQMEADVEICISDSGMQIDPSARYRIFQPLSQQLDGADKIPGLGLSLVQNIINDHSGTVTLESSKLGGSKFRISLPSEAAEE